MRFVATGHLQFLGTGGGASAALRLARRHWIVVPLVLVGAWLRLAFLGAEHLYGDEAEYAIVARYLSLDWGGLQYPALSSDPHKAFVSQPPLVLYLMGISIRLLGTSDFAVMLPVALLGAATVAAVYGLGVRLGGRLHGMVAAALVAVLPFHVSMSRSAMLDVGYAFFLVVGAYFAVAWMQERRARHAVLAGVAGAGAALSKLPGVLVVPVLLAAWLLVATPPASRLALRRGGPAERGDLRAAARHGALMLAPLLVGALAYLALLWRLDALDALVDKLLWNAERVSSGSAKPLTYYFTDPHASFEAQLGRGAFALALAGLGFELFRFLRRPRVDAWRGVVPATTLVLAAFFLLSSRKIGFYLLPFAPLAALHVGGLAAGVRDLVQWAGITFTRRDLRRYAPVTSLVACVALSAPAYAGFNESYEAYARDDEASGFGYGLREAAWWIEENDPGATQYGSLLGRFTLRWYNDHPTYHAYAGDARLTEAVERGELRYVVVDSYLDIPSDVDKMHELIAKYGGVEVARFEQSWASVIVFRLQPHPVLP